MFVLFLLALVAGALPGLSAGSFIFWLLLIGAALFNLSLPKLYGLSLYLNSGNEITFVTKDMEFLKRVVRTLKEFMENPPEGKNHEYNDRRQM